MNDFLNFVREQGVVGVAVGLAIGLQATATVQVLVHGFIDPVAGWLIGLFMDNPEGLDSMELVLVSGSNPLVISWGRIFSSVIALVAVIFVVYFLVKKAHLDKLDKKKDENK